MVARPRRRRREEEVQRLQTDQAEKNEKQQQLELRANGDSAGFRGWRATDRRRGGSGVQVDGRDADGDSASLAGRELADKQQELGLSRLRRGTTSGTRAGSVSADVRPTDEGRRWRHEAVQVRGRAEQKKEEEVASMKKNEEERKYKEEEKEEREEEGDMRLGK